MLHVQFFSLPRARPGVLGVAVVLLLLLAVSPAGATEGDVVAWGSNSQSESNVPVGLVATQVSAGYLTRLRSAPMDQ